MRVPVRGDWQLTPGEDWWEIADLIRGSDTFLFLLTPESVRSPACLRELTLAQSWQKRILPVVRQKPPEDALAELPEVLAKEQVIHAGWATQFRHLALVAHRPHGVLESKNEVLGESTNRKQSDGMPSQIGNDKFSL